MEEGELGEAGGEEVWGEGVECESLGARELVWQRGGAGRSYLESCELSFEVGDGDGVRSSFLWLAATGIGQLGSSTARQDLPSGLELADDLLDLESARFLERLEEELDGVELDEDE